MGLLQNSVYEFEKWQAQFDESYQAYLDISAKKPLFVFDKIISPLQETMPAMKKAVDSALPLMKFLPAFSGYPQEKTYLILLQNNREMRPSGGFIGTYGIITIKDAEIKNLFLDNSYNLDVLVEKTQKIEPPEPIKKYLGIGYWFFRDSNWSPDFSASAKQALEFYKLESKNTAQIDGVIALTPTVVENLLGTLGTFQVDDLNFDKKNFWEQLQYQVEYGYYKQGIKASDRKDIIGVLAKQMIEKVYSLPANDWLKILAILNDSLKEKQLVLYFADPAYEEQAASRNWGGLISAFDGDYLMLNDANLAALKTDSVMSRTLNYKLEKKGDEYIATATASYQNLGDFSWATTRYRSYSRLYVPACSRLLSVMVAGRSVELKDIDVNRELGKASFGVYFEVEPKTTQMVQWQYVLPLKVAQQIVENKYSLQVQKQIGLPKLNLQLDLNFGKKVVGTNKTGVKHFEEIKIDQIYSVWLE